MIPKSEMKPGMWYKGYCRNSYMARWDEKHENFVYIRFKFQYQMDTIPHFEDTKETRMDGFIPMEEIPNLDPKLVKEEKHKVGY